MKKDFSKTVVISISVFLILFTAAILYIFLRIGAEPSTLIVSVFGAAMGQYWNLASIKKKKIDKEMKENGKEEH